MNMQEHHYIEEALLVPQKPVSLVEASEDHLLLERTYSGEGVEGVLTFPNGDQFYTLERPWLGNERRISCIPGGEYLMKMRTSPLVTRLTGGDYTEAWEVMDVPGRTYILIHQGNYVRDTAGCILVGLSQGVESGGQPAVWSSRKAFDQVMLKLSEKEQWNIRIFDTADSSKLP
jgi:hypothetical protein